jgi:YesN/AraC family two-component response regulator
LSIAVVDLGMSKKKSMPVRLSDAAIELARIASGYTGESMAEYVSRVVVERAKQDIERLHAEKFQGSKPKR